MQRFTCPTLVGEMCRASHARLSHSRWMTKRLLHPALKVSPANRWLKSIGDDGTIKISRWGEQKRQIGCLCRGRHRTGVDLCPSPPLLGEGLMALGVAGRRWRCAVLCRRVDRRGMRDGASLWFIREQAQGASPCYRLDAVMHPQFLKDMGHMTFDGIQGDHQSICNLLIGVAASDQMKHVQFAFA